VCAAYSFAAMTIGAKAPLFRPVPQGLEHWDGNSHISRHFHADAYAAVVLAGECEESGSRGRIRARAGDVLLHDMFDSHQNRFGKAGATILNLPLTGAVPEISAGRVSDIDAIARVAERHPEAAAEFLLDHLQPLPLNMEDWTDILANDLAYDQSCRLDRWGMAHGLVPETVSRGFCAVYGTTPARFRAEARARLAIQQIILTTSPLVEIAALFGFSDQPHMTREVRALTGMSPRSWRSNSI
jgi:AraC-like DNA-binding protein